MASVAQAVDYVDTLTWTSGTNTLTDHASGNYDISGYDATSDASNRGIIYLGYNASNPAAGAYGLNVDGDATAVVHGVMVKNAESTIEKIGDGVLTFTGVCSEGDSYQHQAKTFTISAGTVKINDATANSITTNDIVVESGATLHLAAHDALGYNNSAADTVTMKTGSTLIVDARQTLTTNIKLEEGVTITIGTAEAETGNNAPMFQAHGGAVTALGDATLDVDLKLMSGRNITLAAEADKTLTFTGDTTNTGHLLKSGAGTLAIAASSNLSEGTTLDVNEGILDLSDVTTLNAAGLNLADGTTLVLDGDTIDFSGALTVGQDVTLDLSSWGSCSNFVSGETLFTNVTNSTWENAQVTLKFSDGSFNGWLKSDGNGSVKLIPEPATATLSLLALASLAARRRRR